MKKVAIIAFDGCWAMSVFLAKDFFRIVSLLETHHKLEQNYHVQILTSDGKAITSSCHSKIEPDGRLLGDDYDLIIIPPVEGVRLNNMPSEIDYIVDWLKPNIATNTPILSLSTGAYLLAASGLLNSATFATHWAFVSQLEKLFPECKFTAHHSYMKDNSIFTTGSLEACIDVLLAIVAKDKGDRFSQMCATHLLVSDPSKLSPILPSYHNHRDNRIGQVQEWINNNFQKNSGIAEIAIKFGFSNRNLNRRFQQATGTPINRYVQEVRVDKAKKLLLTTQKTIKCISIEVGYENDSFFSRLFKKSTGLTPAKWRVNN